MALISVHVADLHFGCKINPNDEYAILKEQLVDRVEELPFDIFAIDGDIFDKKLMANNDAVLAANKLVSDIVNLCKRKQATLILIAGTRSHDAGQLRLFYHYIEDPEIDIRIVEQITFLEVKGHTILCIPELYGVPESVYQFYLKQSCYYHMCFMHGTFEGAIYGNNVSEGRLFTMDDFEYCMGPIISGHVHTGGCFQKHFYYTGSPIRYHFGEEQEKGFLVVVYDKDTLSYYTHMSKIESYRFDTIDLSETGLVDPIEINNYLAELHANGVHYMRVLLDSSIPLESQNIIKNYWASNGRDYVKFKMVNKSSAGNTTEVNPISTILQDTNMYLVDNSIDPIDKLARYINETHNDTVISADEIRNFIKPR